jgi:hypothetical protein
MLQIKIDSTTKVNDDCKKKSGRGHSKGNNSTFHSVTFRVADNMLNGINEEEKELIWAQALDDFKNGVIIAATLGEEMKDEEKHVHLSMIRSSRAESHVSTDRYKGLIDPSRIAYRTSSNGRNTCTTVFTSQPKNKGALAYFWLAYAWKEKAKGYNDVDTFRESISFTNCAKYRSIGLFDDSEADVVRKKCFAINVWEQWQKKIREKATNHPISWTDWLPDMVEKFRLQTRLEVPWLHEDTATKAKNQTEILFRMVMYKGEKDRYVIPKLFYGKGAKGDKIYSKLIANKPPTGRTSQAYEKMLYNDIQKVVAGVHGLTLKPLKPLVGKRKRDAAQTPVQEIGMAEPINECSGACALDLSGRDFETLPCGHKFCTRCMRDRVTSGFRTCCHCDRTLIPEDVRSKYL